MPSFSAWYNQQYAPWNRTRRLPLATGPSNVPPTTNGAEANSSEPPKQKRQETLFGPNIGIISDGPAWAQSQDTKKNTSSDYLTPEVVMRWVDASKEAIQPTTTLQALVNLKRPTLRLSPIVIQPFEDHSDDLANAERNNHALEFEFDCDAPKCCVTVQVITPSNEQDSHGSFHRTTIYESVFEGGFGRLLKLEDGATIDLGRFEHTATHGSRVVDADQSPHKVEKDLTTTEIPVLSEPSSQPHGTPTPSPDHQENARKRRFTALHFRRRSQNPTAVSGPALAVVDNDTTAVNEGGEREKESPNDDGVRIVIQLVALDDFGKELSPVNRQSTYLHVVRLGPSVAGGEDNRSWVVKVVKREATIGPHTFHLHEIYGLSSASVQHTVPTTDPDTHTYPPSAPTPVEDEPSSECLVCLSSPREVVLLPCRHLVACKECAINMIEFGAGGAIMHAEEPAANTEPQQATARPPAADDSVPPAAATRSAEGDYPAPAVVPEIVVASADGSTVGPREMATQPATNDHPVVVSVPSQAGSAPPAPPTPVDLPAAVVPQNPRRKRRAKGWSCPVCRQPYTSLLRITTSPPAMDGGKEGKRVSTSTIDHPLMTAVQMSPATAPGLVGSGHPLEPTPEEPAAPAPSRSLRPVFFRALSRRPADPATLV